MRSSPRMSLPLRGDFPLRSQCWEVCVHLQGPPLARTSTEGKTKAPPLQAPGGPGRARCSGRLLSPAPGPWSPQGQVGGMDALHEHRAPTGHHRPEWVPPQVASSTSGPQLSSLSWAQLVAHMTPKFTLTCGRSDPTVCLSPTLVFPEVYVLYPGL